MITDEELLAAVRSAGEPGTESHRLACRLYRRSVLEWQAQSPAWRDYRERRDAFRELVALVARTAWARALEDAAACGTRAGYQRHLIEHTVTCVRCRRANAAYDRPRKRAERLAVAMIREMLAEAA